MIYNSVHGLLCAACRQARVFKNILKTDVRVINPQNPDFGDLAEGIVLSEILKASNKAGGRIAFFSSKGDIFTASPIVYQEKAVAYFLAGPLSPSFLKEDGALKKASFSAVNDLKSVWELSELLRLASCGLYSAATPVIGAVPFSGDCFGKLCSHILTAVRAKNLSLFSRKISDMLFELTFKLPDGFYSARAIAFTAFLLFIKICEECTVETKNVFGKNLELFYELKKAKYETEVEMCLKRLTENLSVSVFKKASVRKLAADDAISYINNHYGERLTLSSVASEIFISPHYLSKAFSEETGINFNAYLNRVRIEKAKIILCGENADLKETALAVGFDDQGYFSKVFKKLTGLSPKQYKTEALVKSAQNDINCEFLNLTP